MVNAQEYINKNFPKRIRGQVKNLSIRGKELEGCLDLSDFTNLESIDCAWNKLTSLDLSGLRQLKEIRCNDNYLNDLDLSSFEPDKLVLLNISDNNLPSQDLSVFSRFINLDLLWIGGDDEEKIKKGKYNRFCGSFEPLKNLTKLVSIQVNNTDVNSGVECLPKNVEVVHYSSTKRPESKIEEIASQLNKFLGEKEVKNWKDIHPQFDKESQRGWERLGFSYQETKKWMESGLHPTDYHFAAWLRWKEHKPKVNVDWEKLREKNRSTQEWLDKEYPTQEEKEKVNWINITKSGLEGDLIISDFPNLVRLDCSYNQFSSLTLDNLPKLSYFYASHNNLNDLKVSNCPEITFFDVGDNRLTTLDFLNELNPKKLTFLYVSNNEFPEQNIEIFSRFKNLKQLWLRDNNFSGSLEPLRDLNKLEFLNVSRTEINEGFEYLPNSIKELSSIHSRGLWEKDTDDYRIVTYTGGKRKGRSSEYDPAAYYDFRHWKSAQPHFRWLKEELEKLDPNLGVSDVFKFLSDYNIFFNIKDGTGIFGDKKTLFSFFEKTIMSSKREEEIEFLQKNIQELNSLIEKQKKKIIDAYLNFFTEKDLLRELIATYLEYKKVQKQRLPSVKLKRQYDDLFNDLTEKVGERMMEDVQLILNDCEELATWELELESIGGRKQITSPEETKKIEEEKKTKDLVMMAVPKRESDSSNKLGKLVKKALVKIERYEKIHLYREHDDHFRLLRDLRNIQRDLTVYQLLFDTDEEKIERINYQLEQTKEKLSNVLEKEEIENICQAQEELTDLEIQDGILEAKVVVLFNRTTYSY